MGVAVAEEIQACIDKLTVHMKAGETEEACKLYAEDAEFGTTGVDFVQGRANILEFFKKADYGKDTECKDVATTTDLGNGYAHRAGRCSVETKGKTIKYWYHTLFHKVDGQWFITKDASGSYE